MRRFGTVTKVKPDRLAAYIELHDRIPPEVVEAAARYGLRNFTIFHMEGYLFSYFEYDGEDFAADMAKKAELPETQRWKAACDDCFERMDGMPAYDVPLREIFHNAFAPAHIGESMTTKE